MWVLMYVFSYSVSPAATNDRAEWRLRGGLRKQSRPEGYPNNRPLNTKVARPEG